MKPAITKQTQTKARTPVSTLLPPHPQSNQNKGRSGSVVGRHTTTAPPAPASSSVMGHPTLPVKQKINNTPPRADLLSQVNLHRKSDCHLPMSFKTCHIPPHVQRWIKRRSAAISAIPLHMFVKVDRKTLSCNLRRPPLLISIHGAATVYFRLRQQAAQRQDTMFATSYA